MVKDKVYSNLMRLNVENFFWCHMSLSLCVSLFFRPLVFSSYLMKLNIPNEFVVFLSLI